jgi:CheY-like chemotaxis protein
VKVSERPGEASLAEAPPRALRVVVADDDRDTVLTLMMLLREEGHTVQGVSTGDAVMPLVRKMQPDAVILDIGMPGQSGFAVAQDIHKNFRGARKPLLIAITGQYTRPADQMLSKMVGFNHHLLKPYSTEALLDLLRPLSLPPEPRESP